MRFLPVAFKAAAAVLLWTAALAGMCGGLPAGEMCAVLAPAIILAGMCWLEVRRDRQQERRDGESARLAAEYERREEALIRTLSSLADAPTGPHRWLNSV